MQVVAKLRFARISPQKCRLVADQIRGQSVASALKILAFSRKKAARMMHKVLESAIANAEHNHGADIDELKVSNIQVDGARTFEGVTPDLDLHSARVNASAKTMYLDPMVSVDTWIGLTRDGIKRFDKDTALYVRPMYWAEQNGALLVAPNPDSTKWCLTLYEAPMRAPEGFSITLSIS